MQHSSAISSGTYFATIDFLLAAHLAFSAATMRALPSGDNPRFVVFVVLAGRPFFFLAVVGAAPTMAARACWSRAISASIRVIRVVLMRNSVTQPEPGSIMASIWGE
jgi:hypothetical protein